MYKAMTTNLMVESVEETLAFYEGILGFSLVTSVPNDNGQLQFAILQKDKLSLMIQQRASLTQEYPILETSKVQPSVSLYMDVDDFEQLYMELKEKCQVLYEPHTTFYGATEFAIADNNGYVLTFAKV
ncbi:VOC family protein [Baia soyae]|uniref:Catechol 2,3-dioxygenase-like lactoylglutathione lyase family enzyme n=1 Tax=Baia soyae TaxID=1544746 RepID=A0A4R2RQL6_9BACL|nr:VOC family protein [Baia soyae]TCP65553.1 catechol 2,3-dioxygenase-like lactoylglutathione lyase family enzyme [Baia soyae]